MRTHGGYHRVQGCVCAGGGGVCCKHVDPKHNQPLYVTYFNQFLLNFVTICSCEE